MKIESDLSNGDYFGVSGNLYHPLGSGIIPTFGFMGVYSKTGKNSSRVRLCQRESLTATLGVAPDYDDLFNPHCSRSFQTPFNIGT